ncbi:hypothetical protein CL652_00085 [bacterium]|nr:hypothetical protein [bacterium]|tara:strand:- start:3051 stop:3977 length:927 start_codon:yes stop_codon:yes gene_type:complete
MADYSKKQTKEKILTADKVRRSLVKTGFPFEMEIAEFLQRKGYEVEVNEYFLDLEGGKKREIDIVAFKIVDKVRVNLVIECKHSLQDAWVFICSDKKPARYFAYLMHEPSAYELRKSRLFSHMQALDHDVPLAQNYICLKKHTLKKGDQLQIDECVLKLPKAAFDIASRGNNHKKNLYFPLAVFSGQMFFAKYDGNLEVRENHLVQYGFDFNSETYMDKRPENRLTKEREDDLLALLSTSSESDESRIRRFAQSRPGKFQIEFVTGKGLGKYLKRLEEDVSNISTRKWSYYATSPWDRKQKRLRKKTT